MPSVQVVQRGRHRDGLAVESPVDLGIHAVCLHFVLLDVSARLVRIDSTLITRCYTLQVVDVLILDDPPVRDERLCQLA